MKRALLLLGTALVMLGAALGVGCNKDKSNPEPPPAATASAQPVIAASLPPRAEEEQKANQEITSDNYKVQLEQLEKEIDQP